VGWDLGFGTKKLVPQILGIKVMWSTVQHYVLELSFFISFLMTSSFDKIPISQKSKIPYSHCSAIWSSGERSRVSSIYMFDIYVREEVDGELIMHCRFGIYRQLPVNQSYLYLVYIFNMCVFRLFRINS
jgi:hypothetical protein